MPRETKTARAVRLATLTEDAYSFYAYGMAEWTKAVRFLIDMSYGDADIENIMRSKWTRWARDCYSTDEGKGTGEMVRRFVTEYAGRKNYRVEDLAG